MKSSKQHLLIQIFCLFLILPFMLFILFIFFAFVLSLFTNNETISKSVSLFLGVSLTLSLLLIAFRKFKNRNSSQYAYDRIFEMITNESLTPEDVKTINSNEGWTFDSRKNVKLSRIDIDKIISEMIEFKVNISSSSTKSKIAINNGSQQINCPHCHRKINKIQAINVCSNCKCEFTINSIDRLEVISEPKFYKYIFLLIGFFFVFALSSMFWSPYQSHEAKRNIFLFMMSIICALPLVVGIKAVHHGVLYIPAYAYKNMLVCWSDLELAGKIFYVLVTLFLIILSISLLISICLKLKFTH